MNDDKYPATWDREAIEKWQAAHPDTGEPWEPKVYDEFVGSAAWQAVDQAISDLVENQDLVEGTLRYHIVGYLVKQLTKAGVVRRKAAEKPDSE